MSTEPAPGMDNPLGIPGGDMVTQLGKLQAALAEETKRADHFERMFAAVVGKYGPIPVRPSEYNNARPAEVQTVHTMNVFGPDDGDGPLTFCMPEHEGDHEGMVTRDKDVIAALENTAGASLADQARAVLTALGLPAAMEW